MALNLYTIAPDADFIGELVKAVLAGFPLGEGWDKPALETYTILVPNRRAARALREAFIRQSKAAALLLPRIRPIGDLDDEDFDPLDGPETGYGVLTPVAQHFALIKLVHDWTSDYPHLPLADTLRHSPAQLQALARSLSDLLNSLDIEEQSPASLAKATGLEVAAHQEALVSLLQLVQLQLPKLLNDSKRISANSRRNELISHYARQLETEGASGPVIAAGSTGSIPATRRLLATIAGLPQGAVVLPGLDTGLDDACWQAITPQHPQFALKQLLLHIGVGPHEVMRLGPMPGARSFLTSELMRPSETTHEWAGILGKARPRIEQAIAGLDLMECRDSEEEAAAIATLVRLRLEDSTSGNIAIVTPDRQMARRLTTALARWHIVPENSAGEPLNAFGAAHLLRLVIDVVREPQSTEALAALLHHPAACFGYSAGDATRLAAMADITLLRSPLMMLGFEQIPQLIATLPEAIGLGLRQSDLAPSPGSAEWDELTGYAIRVHGALAALMGTLRLALDQQLHLLMRQAQAIGSAELWTDEPAMKLLELADSLASESGWLPDVTMAEAAALLDDYMARTQYTERLAATPRISIVGLLEARLQSFDVVVLAGLSESIWPGMADSGPWLNRPMRDELQIKQPEASIGQMAHDVAQSLGAPQLVLSWSREDAGKPLTQSRWLLRLKAVLKGAGVSFPLANGERWRALAGSLDQPAEEVRISIPSPTPPVAARLRKLSITKADTLIKDAYAVYASDILNLKPLEEISEAGSYSLRGQIFHLALSLFFKQHPASPPDDIEAALQVAGERAFQLLPAEAAVVRNSWWPRYLRVAQWLAGRTAYFYAEGAALFSEASIAHDLEIDGHTFKLSGRADLIRIGADNSVGIFDFKSGSVPAVKDTGPSFSHQLTLEAAILETEGFRNRDKLRPETLAYVKVSGATPAGDVMEIKPDVVARSSQHLAGLVQLLSDYMAADQPFMPRANAKPDYNGRHDHLSRYKEWSTRGPAP